MCPYVPYVTRMLLVCYPYVLVWCFSHDRKLHVISVFVNWYCSHACQNKLSYWVITRLLCSVQQNEQLNYGVVTSLPKSNSLNETILFPTTTRIQTASILTEFDENPDLKHAVGQPK